MIDEIVVTNVALIRHASFQPSSGLTVLTGETGAGKTALLSAISLLIGQKADVSRIREGADALCVEARLYGVAPVSYTHLTLPTILRSCRSRWSPYH